MKRLSRLRFVRGRLHTGSNSLVPQNSRAGVTLIEMLIVVTLIGLMAGISFPSVSSGLDGLRLAQATDSISGFLNTALTRAERRQQVMEVTISLQDNSLSLQGPGPGVLRRLEMPEGVTIRQVFPMIPGLAEDAPRNVLLLPGGTVPRVGVEIMNRRGVRRIIRIDPMTGVPQIEVPEDKQ